MDLAKKLVIAGIVLALLPMSPFSAMISYMENIPYLNYLNWFVPISEIISVTETWLVVVSVYYGIMWLLNYIGVLKS